jgi:penicillin-binding protein 2
MSQGITRRLAVCAVLFLLSFLAKAPLLEAAARATRATRATRGTHMTRSHRSSRFLRRIGPLIDPTLGDIGSFDDPVVRQAAVTALGHLNGSVVAADPNTGRILSIVNQKMAFSSGFEPCSTIKPVIAVAALDEGLIRGDSLIRVGYRRYLDLVQALAISNNAFFEELGRRLGFDSVSRYARQFGLGELSGYGLTSEAPGTFPTAPPLNGGVARMSSFGEGIKITPLQLASVAATLANGGSMYYLQYPRSDEELHNFTPRLKRQLDIAPLLSDVREGMLAAVLYGTARHSYDPYGQQTLGKTGTCSDESGHLGWFASYADELHPKLVLVVLLRGSYRHRVSGPRAAEVAGHIYRDLSEHNFFAETPVSSNTQ